MALGVKAIQGGIKGGCGMNVVNLLKRLGQTRRELGRRVLRERRLMEALGNILGPRQVPNGDSSEDVEWPAWPPPSPSRRLTRSS